MTIHHKLAIVAALGLLIVASPAYSGASTTATTGSSGGTYMTGQCVQCEKVPPPLSTCVYNNTTFAFCGSEAWMNNGQLDCKHFDRVTMYCVDGSTNVYVNEYFKGPGYTCGDNTDCYVK